MRTFVVAGVLIIFYVMQLLLQEKALRHVDGDGSGYYAYLPALFIHNTPDFTPVLHTEKKRHSLDYMAHYFHPMNGVLINKFYLGAALMMMPFFLLAMLFSWISGMPVDGYNIIFQYAVALSGALWLAVGLIALQRLLSLYQISKPVIVLSTIVVILGTNLFYYAFLQPSHSHVYSFAAIALLIYQLKKFFLNQTWSSFHAAAVYFGLVFLVRPTNVLVLAALPFIAGSKDALLHTYQKLAANPRQLLRGVLIVCSIASLQLIYNFSLTGKIFLWSYQNEGFNFLRPAFFDFLFSFRKGFFIYTPIMVFSLLGILLMWKSNRWSAVSFIAFFVMLVYILSSWWNWYYGDGFGMRPMIDFYALFAVPIGMFIENVLKKKATSYFVLSIMFILLVFNLFQTWQYKAGIIHPDAMNREKYLHVLLKTGEQYRDVFGGNTELIYGDNLGKLIFTFSNTMEHSRDPWTSNGIQFSEDAFSGQQLAQMNQSNIYSPTLVLQRDQLVSTEGNVYVRASLVFREQEPNAAQDALLVFSAQNEQQAAVFYKALKIKSMPDKITNEWRPFETGFRVPVWDSTVSEIKMYVWNKERRTFQLDDFQFSFYHLKQ